jgi:dihydroorotase
MRVLIKNAVIVAPGYPAHGKNSDIFIEDGIIAKIAENIEATSDKVISEKNLHISVGWMDCFADFGEPGGEHRETMANGLNAAAAGGFTSVMLVPNTEPVTENKSQVEYLIQKSAQSAVDVLPVAAVTKGIKGKELNEMYELFTNGALAFSDGYQPIQTSGILQKALQYVLPFKGTIIQLPNDETIGKNGLMNEGIYSTRLGLAGKPALSEELMVARDIELLRYTQSALHFTGISTRKSLELIKAAKKDNLRVSCSVAPYHLYFTDEDIEGYDTNLKVNPPLRTADDRQALRDGLMKGDIDFIASHHQPWDWDHKVCEFDKAAFGMEGLESVFGVAGASGISVESFIKMQTENIRKVFNLPNLSFVEGEKANLTLFLPGQEFVFEENNIFSKSRNNAFIGKKLKGKVFGIINKDRLFLN